MAKEDRCIRCGKPIGSGWYYCPDCIAKIKEEHKEYFRVFEEEKRRGR